MTFRNAIPHAVRHAQDLRKRSTEAEAVFWNVVRNRKFHGLKFRRQVPVGRFIADFMCTNPPLIIEIDGPIHDFKIREDAKRTEIIRYDYEIPILRLKNKEILENLPKALERIEHRLTPNPSPASAGEGSSDVRIKKT